jgi:hypothetical protein
MLARFGVSLLALHAIPISVCSALRKSFLNSHLDFSQPKSSNLAPRSLLPPYSNASSLPLFEPDSQPHRSDIGQAVSKDGWFEASVAAILDVNRTVIKGPLRDCGDGTVNVTLFKPQDSLNTYQTFNVNKRIYGNNGTVAWPAALFDGLEKLYQQNSTQSNQNIMDVAIKGLYEYSMVSPCNVSDPNLYTLTKGVPIVAYIAPNASDASIAGRWVHLMEYDPPPGTVGDFVSIDTASIVGAGSGTKNISLVKWDKECSWLELPASKNGKPLT